MTGLALAAIALAFLSGCGGGTGSSGFLGGASSIFGGSRTIALAPIAGAPEKVKTELTQALITAGKDRNLTLIPGTSGGEYVMRGYLLAAPDRRGSKISYIWDITDADGARVTRVSGDQNVARGSASNPWSGVNSAAINAIASNTTSQLAANLSGGSSSSTAPTAAAPAAAPAAAARPASQPKPSGVVVGTVVGAPGDGARSLPAALRKKLAADGVKLASSSSRNVYTVKGFAKLSSAGSGKEKIQIDWQVIDPAGKRLGTVSQQNVIPKGSLNGPWGAIAPAAAAAAADGIEKLIPKSG